jgi:hypothetical protein
MTTPPGRHDQPNDMTSQTRSRHRPHESPDFHFDPMEATP